MNGAGERVYTARGNTLGVLWGTFAVTNGTTLAPLKVAGNVTFNGAPVVVVSPRYLTPGTYPLLVVGGTAPMAVPQLSGVLGYLRWGGPGNKTLYLTRIPEPTVFMLR